MTQQDKRFKTFYDNWIIDELMIQMVMVGKRRINEWTKLPFIQVTKNQHFKIHIKHLNIYNIYIELQHK